MWTGTPWLEHCRRLPRAPRRTGSLRVMEAPSLRRVHVGEVEHAAAPSRFARRSRRHRRASRGSRTRPITSTPNGTARPLPSSRSRSVPSCSTTEAIASSRERPSRKPGWNTTTSAPHAAAMPALRSSAPTAEENFASLGLEMTHEPRNSGAWTESHDVCGARRLADAAPPTGSPSRSRLRSRSRRRRSHARAGSRSPLWALVASGDAGQADTDARP